MRIALLFILLLLTACDQGPTLERLGGPAMGSSYSIQYVREPGGPAPAQVQAAVETILGDIDRHYSTYRSDSTVSRFNQLPANQCLALPPDMLELVALGQHLAEQSDGAFDLTVEPLLDLWGFGPQARHEQVPDPQALAQVRQRVGHRHLHIEGQALCKDAPVQLDFNSIAAGHAVDLIAARLLAMGVASFVAEATGELKAVGRKPDGSPWRIALELPAKTVRSPGRSLRSMAFRSQPRVTIGTISRRMAGAIRTPSMPVSGALCSTTWPQPPCWMSRRCRPTATRHCC